MTTALVESSGESARGRRGGALGIRRSARLVPELARALERELGADAVVDPVPHLERSPRSTLVARGRNRSLYLVREMLPDGAALYLKHQRYPLPGRLFTWVFGAFGRRELDALRTARALGAATVVPLGGGAAERGPFVHETWLATRAIPRSQNLSVWQKAGGDGRAAFPPDEVRGALPVLWRTLARLHAERFYARTIGGKNVLVYRGEDGSLAFALHDLPRAVYRPGRPLSVRLAAHDLARLERWAVRWLEPGDRSALLAAYCEALGEGPPLAVWRRRVARSLDRRLRRTLVNRLLHGGRRWLKDLPGIGVWFR
jgi:hypothetical protein